MPELLHKPAIWFWIALFIALVGTPIARQLAIKFDILDHPRAGQHKTHREPTPYLGGLFLTIAVLITFAVCGTWLPYENGATLGGITNGIPREVNVPLACLAIVYIFVLGLLDDIGGSGQGYKMSHIGVAGTLLYLSGIHVEWTPWHAVNYPLTIFWLLGITNAANLMDNMNGLSSGTGAIVAFGYALLATLRNDPVSAAIALALSGGLLGFWVYNFPKAKIFLGDAGAMTLGFTLATLGLLTGRPSENLGADPTIPQVLASIYMTSIFIADTFFVAFSRGARKIHFWDGGKDHTSHRFVNLGLTPVQAVLAVYSLAAILTASAAAMYFLPSAIHGGILAVVILSGSIAFWHRLDRVPVKS